MNLWPALLLAVACRASGPEESTVGPDTAEPADSLTSWNGMHLVRVPAGTFTMGGGVSDEGDYFTDHEVTLTRDFWLARTEVTVVEWLADVADSGDWDRDAARCPDDLCALDQLAWTEAARFLNWMSEGEGLPSCYESDGSDIAGPYLADPYACAGYRFPTEAEWEYAAKAGEDTRWAGSDDYAGVAWTDDNCLSNQPVCTLDANAYGLCDMSGNVLEWVSDWYDWWSNDATQPVVDPFGPGSSTNEMRANRGGAWWLSPDYAEVTARTDSHPDEATGGLRVARTIHP